MVTQELLHNSRANPTHSARDKGMASLDPEKGHCYENWNRIIRSERGVLLGSARLRYEMVEVKALRIDAASLYADGSSIGRHPGAPAGVIVPFVRILMGVMLIPCWVSFGRHIGRHFGRLRWRLGEGGRSVDQ